MYSADEGVRAPVLKPQKKSGTSPKTSAAAKI